MDKVAESFGDLFQSLLSQGISLLLDSQAVMEVAAICFCFNPFLVRASVYWPAGRSRYERDDGEVSIPS